MGSQKLIALLLAAGLLISGCATFGLPRTDQKQCSDSPLGAVMTFIEGMAEFSLWVLKSVVIPGISVWAVFGEGDTQRGKEIVRQLTNHPEVAGEDRSCVCSLIAMEETGNPWEKIVHIKRETLVGDKELNYRRSFLVRFGLWGNCIRETKALDPAWIRIP